LFGPCMYQVPDSATNEAGTQWVRWWTIFSLTQYSCLQFIGWISVCFRIVKQTAAS
jgi:hypothetical protein